MRERGRSAGILLGGGDAGQPGLYRPGQGVARPRFADGDRLGCGKPGAACQLPGGVRLGLQPPPCHFGLLGLQRKPGRQPLADAEDRVDRPRCSEHPNGQAPPLGELLIDQRAHHLCRDAQLVGMHLHTGQHRREGARAQPPFDHPPRRWPSPGGFTGSNPEVLAVRVASLAAKEELLAADPGKFFTEPHYNGFPAVLVRLPAIDVGELAELITDAWRCQAPRTLAAELGRPPQ